MAVMGRYMNKFWKCFLIINTLGISAVVAQDKLIPKPVPTIPMERVLPPGVKVLPAITSPRLPPEEFVYFSDKYILNEVEVESPNIHCRQVFAKYNIVVAPGMRVSACTEKVFDKTGKYIQCNVFLPAANVVAPAKYRELFIHELGHCNGWVHD